MIRRGAVVVLALMLATLQWRLWVADGGIAHTHRLQVQVKDADQVNQQMRERNASLDAEVLDLKSGQAAIEARARTSLGMIKPGETFFLVVEPQS